MTDPGKEESRERTARIYARAERRLLPLLFIGYVVAYLNRVNVGFAKLGMIDSLGFNDTVYGLGAGAFFIGYFLFEVPSNVLLQRIGARIWIARIMVTWGLISAATLFVTTAGWFYSLRFALGAAEAGFFPGIILYLTYWFPSKRRARITAWFISGIAFSGVVGGPVSGWIMTRLAGQMGYAGWQWLLLVEAAPALMIGAAILFRLPDSIQRAKWLSDDEKALLQNAKSEDDSGKTVVRFREVFLHSSVWLLCAIYFADMMGLYGISFWMPQIIRNTGVHRVLDIGFLSAIPYGVAAVLMIIVSRTSDRTGERRIYAALSMFAAAAGFAMIAWAGSNTAIAMVGLTLSTTGVLTAMPLLWTFPAALLAGTAAAAGIALINSVGNLGGFACPWLLGALNDATHTQTAGLSALSASLTLGSLLVLRLQKQPVGSG